MRVEAKVLQLLLLGSEGRASPPVIGLMRTHTIGGGNLEDIGRLGKDLVAQVFEAQVCGGVFVMGKLVVERLLVH